MKQFQIFALDANLNLVWAGVHHNPRINQRIARKIQRKWQAWRKRYLTEHPNAKYMPLGEVEIVKYLKYYDLAQKDNIKIIKINS